MSTTEPQAGEWWWVEIADGGWCRPAEVVIEPRTGRLCWEMDGRLVNARPIARIPDPPAPEPTEAGYVTVPVDLLKDCADELEAWVRFAYPEDSRKYPSEERRYVRDMEPVRRLRAAIEAAKGDTR